MHDFVAKREKVYSRRRPTSRPAVHWSLRSLTTHLAQTMHLHAMSAKHQQRATFLQRSTTAQLVDCTYNTCVYLFLFGDLSRSDSITKRLNIRCEV